MPRFRALAKRLRKRVKLLRQGRSQAGSATHTALIRGQLAQLKQPVGTGAGRESLAASAPPQIGTAAYSDLVQGEIAHYEQTFGTGEGRETLLVPVPPSWSELERRASGLIRAATGADLQGNVLARLNRQPGMRMLSLGSGPGGVEFGFAREAPGASIHCLDLSPSLVEMGQQRAQEQGLAVTFEAADLNTHLLPADTYDLVFCHASLHHLIALEHIAAQITKTLRPGGELITVDVITDNGYRMWEQTRQVVRSLWTTLPVRFRINHTAYGEARFDPQIWEADTSETSMECIRSAEILPILERTFTVVHHVPYFSICRRFLDTMYGPNYDLDQPLDRALFDWLWELDRYYLTSGQLRPETFFGIYRKA